MKITRASHSKDCYRCQSLILTGDMHYPSRKGKHLCLNCGNSQPKLTKLDKIKLFIKEKLCQALFKKL